MKTVYYTPKFEKELHETNCIIYLTVCEFITLNEERYKIVWKLFNAEDNIMVYHCELT